jgi:hypothetical protein
MLKHDDYIMTLWWHMQNEMNRMGCIYLVLKVPQWFKLVKTNDKTYVVSSLSFVWVAITPPWSKPIDNNRNVINDLAKHFILIQWGKITRAFFSMPNSTYWIKEKSSSWDRMDC